MLALDDVTKAYSGRLVLDRLCFAIAAGENVALIGANGSGKTTTLRCVAGLARLDGGRISIAGEHSYLPQRPAFPATLTVRETLQAVARLRRLPLRTVDRELDACAIAHVADRYVSALSGGERQRLGLAVALLPTVDLYLFDEPSASLDPAASRILFSRAADLKRGGHTLLFTTHVPADLSRLATRVLVLGDGRIAAEATAAFERRRYERMLGGFSWSHENDDANADEGNDGRPDYGVGGRVFELPRSAACAD